MTSLYQIQDGNLVRTPTSSLEKESLIEDWVENDPALIGLDALIIGRQVRTVHGKFIDLLAIDASGDIIIIELKRDKSSRDIVAQTLDYASWVRKLSTPDIYEISNNYLPKPLAVAFGDKFGKSIPDSLNGAHGMMIIASELDPASQRIVEYLSEEHNLKINTAFFTTFSSGKKQWITTDFLLDQDAVEDRSEKKTKAPWQGYYFVNSGVGDKRSWEDMRQYGFIAAGHGLFYSKRLDQLEIGDEVFVYQKGEGYIGYGKVKSTKVPASEFDTETGLLFEQELDNAGIMLDAHDPEMAEYVVGIDWHETVDIPNAYTFKGAFANQNIVCKLRDQATLEFLLDKFSVK